MIKKPSRELLDAFLEWYGNDPHSKNEEYYSARLTREVLAGLSREQFIEFFFQFARDGGMVQSGGHRTAPLLKQTIDEKYEAFREFVLQPFSDGFDEVRWLERINEFKGFGQGLATIYLNRVDKNRFAILNNKATEAIALFGVDVPAVIGQGYVAVRDAQRQFIEWYPELANLYRTDALAQFLIGEELGRRWADELRGNAPPSEARHWVIAPGERAEFWENCLQEGIIRVGWDELNEDLSLYRTEDNFKERHQTAYSTGGDFKGINEFVNVMKPGDRLFVKQGLRVVIGYGEVASDYQFDSSLSRYRHLRRVLWKKAGQVLLPEGITQLPRKTLTPVDEQTRVAELLKLTETLDDVMERSLFSDRAFTLLRELHEHPQLSFYNAHASEFVGEIEKPLQRLMGNVARALPAKVLNGLETERRIFSRIPKNDYGRGGAWDFYWGAFYPKGGKRTADPQLYVVISAKGLRFGFCIGDYGQEPRRRFAKNCADHASVLIRLLESTLSSEDLIYGETEVAEGMSLLPSEGKKLSWKEWLGEPGRFGFQVVFELPPEKMVKLPEANLIDTIVQAFLRLFPLMLIAQTDEPLELIGQYLGTEPPEEEKNPVYSLEQFSSETFMPRDEIERWVRAAVRKRQVIFYGPPGTGKTFIAQLLAKHLIGGGDGFTEILQFHPSYAYEDFIQGLRPKALKDGGIEYAMVPGRFKEFCSRARECKEKCVLVLDEINRANLSRVFAELMYLLEYRKESVPLAAGDRFQIPENVFIIGTMNTADRSIALVDHALRRRFAFLALCPNYEVLHKFHGDTGFEPSGLIKVLQRLNTAINDKHYSVGMSFFLDREIKTKIQDVWQMEIEAYIEELFFDQPTKAAIFTWDKVRQDIEGT